MLRRRFLSLLFLCAVYLVNIIVFPVHADGDVNLTDLPSQLANALGISVFAASLLASAIFLFAFLLPVAIWGKESVFPTAIIGFVVMGFLVAVGWLPAWVMLMTVLLVAGMYAVIWKHMLG